MVIAELFDRVPSTLGVAVGCSLALLWHHVDKEPLSLVWAPENVLKTGFFHGAHVALEHVLEQLFDHRTLVLEDLVRNEVDHGLHPLGLVSSDLLQSKRVRFLKVVDVPPGSLANLLNQHRGPHALELERSPMLDGQRLEIKDFGLLISLLLRHQAHKKAVVFELDLL